MPATIGLERCDEVGVVAIIDCSCERDEVSFA
jgi:hypothetical protein